MKNIINYFKQGGILFLILCIALILNHRFGYITIIGCFSILVFGLVALKSKMDKGAWVILLYLLFYILFSYFSGFTYSLSTLVLCAIAPFIFYQYGGKIVKDYKTENNILIAWLLIVFCYSIDIFYISIDNILTTGQLINPNRTFSFTDDDSGSTAATLVGLHMAIGMVGLPMAIIVKNKIAKIAFFSLFLLSLIVTFSLLNRTGIVVAILCFIIVIGCRSRKNLKIFISSIFIFSIVIAILFYTNIISTDLISFYEERNVDAGTMGDRSYRWTDAIQNLFIHPFGWADGSTYFVHNMWLDVARISGIIPFALLVYMAYDSFMKAFRLIKYHDNSLSYMMLGLNVCFFASCFVEPIYGGTHFMLYCMLWGTESALLKNKSNFNISGNSKTRKFIIP